MYQRCPSGTLRYLLSPLSSCLRCLRQMCSLEINIDTFKSRNSAMSPTSATSSWYSQSEETTMSSERATMPISALRPRLLLPPKSLCSDVPQFPPTSPHSARFPISPDAANSSRPQQSLFNPFVSPPVPRLTTKLCRLASPLLPA